ncbi:Serine proteinase inhibitor 2 [Thelohanellus kitauei]|uniref:Serine proteinase inhibitor 2 n=1 Tax=Thelohanellus kitauei TaxID=669202 RepID=A0A0C2NDY1_THEKT|nr:Serine proteinase inhibitor 2 [Thelohanellus kitauei]
MHGSSKKIFDEGMIRENMIAYIDSLFVGVDWKNYFDSSLTQHETFYDRQGQPMKVEMMSQTEMHRIYYSPDGNFSILFKRLGEKNQFAAIVLPTKGYSIEEFDEMKIYLNSSKMNMVKVKLPKFKIIGQNDLKSTLNLFGVTDILDLHHSDFGHMTNSTVFIGSLIQLVHVSVGELGVNAEDDDDIDEESIPGEENDGEDTVDQPKSEADDKNEDQDDQQRSDVEDDEERNEVDKSLLETELDGEEKGDQSLPEREQVINDNEEKSHSESEDSEDTFDQSLTEEDFFVVRPFLFLMYSSQEGVVFYSGVVTNPNAH